MMSIDEGIEKLMQTFLDVRLLLGEPPRSGRHPGPFPHLQIIGHFDQVCWLYRAWIGSLHFAQVVGLALSGAICTSLGSGKFMLPRLRECLPAATLSLLGVDQIGG